MSHESETDYTTSGASGRSRPRRRPVRATEQSTQQKDPPPALTEDFAGLAVQYTYALLFVGWEINGLAEITVYPRGRFPSDDRVHGHLGYVRVPWGTPWDEVLGQVDGIVERAERNYRLAVTLRSQAQQAGGVRFDNAYHTITDLFRESWQGWALRLQREGEFTRQGVTFSGSPPAPLLVTWRGDPYTLQVYSTGSILLVSGDQRRKLGEG